MPSPRASWTARVSLNAPLKSAAPKYRNKKTVIDGIIFDSLREANRYCDLRLLQKAGQIHSLETHKRFRLEINGVLLATYVSDFFYIDVSGKKIIEDVKGYTDPGSPVYRLFLIKSRLASLLYAAEVRVVK